VGHWPHSRRQAAALPSQSTTNKLKIAMVSGHGNTIRRVVVALAICSGTW
jgi:hypothetical protein